MLFLGMLVSAPAAGEESADTGVSLTGNETFISESVGDNGRAGEGVHGDDDNFMRFRNRLFFSARAPGFDSALNFDATLFHLPPKRVSRDAFIPGGEGYTTLDYDNDFRLEHLHGSFETGDLKVTLGDFHVSFGRGMVLSLIKLNDLEENNQLRGARLDYRIPRKLAMTLVGGVVNAVNTDPITRQIYPDDPLDRIIGVRAAWELLDALSLGIHGVIMKPRYTSEQQISRDRLYWDRSPGIQVMTSGGFLEMHLEGIHAYLEGNGQSYENFRAYGEAPVNGSGSALFGEISYDLSPFGIKAEGIFYRKWLMEGPYRGVGDEAYGLSPLVYNNIVTLEPRFIPIKSMGNVFGGRLGGTLYLDAAETELSLRTAVLHYNSGLMPDGTWRDHPETLVVHPALEVTKTFRDPAIRIHFEGGARYESTQAPEREGVDSGYLWHLKSDIDLPVKGRHSLAVVGEVRRHHLDITEGNLYYVSLISLGYRLSGRFDVNASYEYSDEVLGERHRLGNRAWLPPGHYALLMGTLDLSGFRDDLKVRGSIGSQRGGIKCAGGICRQYPDSVGVVLEVNLKF